MRLKLEVRKLNLYFASCRLGVSFGIPCYNHGGERP